MEYTQLTAEQQTQEMGSRLLQTLNDQAHRNAAQMVRIDNWAEPKNQTIAALEKQSQATKDLLDAVTKDLDKIRKDQEAWKITARAGRRAGKRQLEEAQKAGESLIAGVQANIAAIQKMVENEGKERLSRRPVRQL